MPLAYENVSGISRGDALAAFLQGLAKATLRFAADLQADGFRPIYGDSSEMICKGFPTLAKRPLVGITCCTRLPGDPVQAVAERYLHAAPFMGADAVLVPSTRDVVDIRSIVGRLDGILLTGSPSNIAPRRYGAEEEGTGPFDPLATRP